MDRFGIFPCRWPRSLKAPPPAVGIGPSFTPPPGRPHTEGVAAGSGPPSRGVRCCPRRRLPRRSRCPSGPVASGAVGARGAFKVATAPEPPSNRRWAVLERSRAQCCAGRGRRRRAPMAQVSGVVFGRDAFTGARCAARARPAAWRPRHGRLSPALAFSNHSSAFRPRAYFLARPLQPPSALPPAAWPFRSAAHWAPPCPMRAPSLAPPPTPVKRPRGSYRPPLPPGRRR